MFVSLSPFGPPTAIGGSASAKKVNVGGKLGIVRDPFGAAEYLGATLPLDSYGIMNLSVSEDSKVLIGQLKGMWSANIFDNSPRPHQSHAWNVESLVKAALAADAQDRLSKHISLPAEAEQLIGNGIGWPAGTDFDPDTVKVSVEGRMGDVMEIDLKRRIAYALLGITTLPANLTANGAPDGAIADANSDIPAIMGALSNFVLDTTLKESLTDASRISDTGFILATEKNGDVLSRAGDQKTVTSFQDEGRIFLIPNITSNDLEDLRSGKTIGDKTVGAGNGYVRAYLARDIGNVKAGWKLIELDATSKDFAQAANTYFGDRSTSNPGYSRMEISGPVGVGRANDRLDVYKVEQRLKYLGFPVFGDKTSGYVNLGRGGRLGIPTEFSVDGSFGSNEEMVLRGFYAATHYLYNKSSLSNGIQTATSPSEKSVQPSGGAASNYGWLNAFNSPHWVNVYEMFGIPYKGSNSLFINGQHTREVYATSWLADLVQAWVEARGLSGLSSGKLQINGLTDPSYLFSTHNKGGHSVGMGLDLGFSASYIDSSHQTKTYDQPSSPLPVSGWSLANAITLAGLLPSLKGNDQAGALRNFLSIYATTISDGDSTNANGTWEELDVRNGSVVRRALFGSGVQDRGQLVQNVWIGGDLVIFDKKKNRYVTTTMNHFNAMNDVLGALGFGGAGLNHGPIPPHYNHFHLDIRAPQLVPLPKYLVLDGSERQAGSSLSENSGYYTTSSDALLAGLEYHDVTGVCVAVPNYEGVQRSLFNSLGPVQAAVNYFRQFRNIFLKDDGAAVDVVSKPAHGRLIDAGDGYVEYLPDAGYFGQDSVSFDVRIDGYEVRVDYVIYAVDDDVGSDWIETYCGDSGFQWDKTPYSSASTQSSSNLSAHLNYLLSGMPVPGGDLTAGVSKLGEGQVALVRLGKR